MRKICCTLYVILRERCCNPYVHLCEKSVIPCTSSCAKDLLHPVRNLALKMCCTLYVILRERCCILYVILRERSVALLRNLARKMLHPVRDDVRKICCTLYVILRERCCTLYVILCERSVAPTCVRCTWSTENYPAQVPETHINQGRTNLGRPVTKFCAVALNILSVITAVFPLQQWRISRDAKSRERQITVRFTGHSRIVGPR